MSGVGLGQPPDGTPLAAWYDADLLDAERLDAALAASMPDSVVHLAGQSSAGRSHDDPVGTFRANVLATWNLLEAVRRRAPSARVLVVGSGEIYGPQPEGTRVPEETQFSPVNPYGLSKAAADVLADRWGRLHELDVVRTRSFAHAGPGQDTRFVLPSIARQLVQIEQGAAEPVLRVGNLDVVRDLADVRDIVEAYGLLLERGEPGVAYNVGRGEGFRLSETVEQLVRLARVRVRIEVDSARLRPADVPYLVGDCSRLRRATGWEPRFPLDRTLSDVLEDWRARERTKPA